MYSVGNHQKSITSCSVHPRSEYALFASKDGKWSFHNVLKGTVIQTIEVEEKIPI